MDHEHGPQDRLNRQALLQELGSSLRAARERHGLSLKDLAAQLHMGPEQLRALEAGDESKLPEPVFVIAQARRLADALGIDINPLLASLKQPSTLALTAATGQTQSGDAHRKGGWPVLLLVAAAGMAAVAGIGVFWAWPLLHRPAKPSEARVPALKTSAVPSPPPVTAASLRLRSPQTSWIEVQRSNGTVLFQGNIQGERSFPLAGGLRVKAGRPDLVQASLGNGPARALGPIELIRWVSFPEPGATAPAP